MSDFTLTNVSSVGTLVMAICYMIYKVVKHSRCRSLCCGNKTEVQIDLDEEHTSVADSEQKKEDIK
jgi:hypothetical protein